jgi:FMN phosphatase YigB (HAD superfamily)
MKPRALVFDAYGTLFDVHSVVLRAGDGIAGDLHSLSTLWRPKQLEFTWLHALMEIASKRVLILAADSAGLYTALGLERRCARPRELSEPATKVATNGCQCWRSALSLF